MSATVDMMDEGKQGAQELGALAPAALEDGDPSAEKGLETGPASFGDMDLDLNYDEDEGLEELFGL